MKEHDPDICICLEDAQGEPDTYIPCGCPCDECVQRTKRIRRWLGIEKLSKRLLNGGVDPEVLADLMWCICENDIEERIRKEVANEVRRLLKGMKIQSEIWGTSLDIE